MNLQAYLTGCKRSEFEWQCDESGTYGDGNSVDVESVSFEGRCAKITRYSSNEFQAEVDNLNNEPFYDVKSYVSRLNARKWCEKTIRKDINKSNKKDLK